MKKPISLPLAHLEVASSVGRCCRAAPISAFKVGHISSRHTLACIAGGKSGQSGSSALPLLVAASRRARLLLLPFIFLLSSCACPHRKAEASHVVERFAGRVDGLVWRETWRDAEQGGGQFFFTDPAASQLFAAHTNQTALGGGSVFSTGTVTITVDTNTAPILGAAGTAAGNIIGAAAKSSVK
jgi:hypothetical protein